MTKAIEKIREEVLNKTLVFTAFIGSMAYLISLTRLFKYSFSVSYIVEFVVLASIVSAAFFRKRISNAFKAMVFISVILLFSFYDASQYGLFSSARVYIILIPFFSFLYLRFNAVLIIHLLTILGFVLVGYFHSKGILTIPENYVPNVYVFKLYPWIINIIHITIVAFVVLIITRMFLKTYDKMNVKLESYNDELAMQVKIQTEHLETANEELKATNDELYIQKEELGVTLESLKSAQSKLIESEKMASLGILTAGVAHEINNPLNYIYSGVIAIQNYLAENYPKAQNDMNPFLEAVETGVERTTNIVKSLGRYSRSEDLPKIEIDIYQVIDDALIMLYNQYKDRIKIIKEYEIDKPVIKANEGQIHQVLLNVLLNAIQAIEEEGEIKIVAEKLNNKLKLTISDTGRGIDEKKVKHIFDPFFTTKDPGQGTGLGLSISKKIVLDHHGEIICKSLPEKGTSFVISLPLITE